MHVSSSAGTRRSSPRAGPESVRSLRGRRGLGPFRADGVGGILGAAGHAPHLGLPPHFEFDFPGTKNQLALTLRWPGGL